ncbi:MAG: hypothetical protein WBA93_27025 [Microcoleaceae cyanobacterium]
MKNLAIASQGDLIMIGFIIINLRFYLVAPMGQLPYFGVGQKKQRQNPNPNNFDLDLDKILIEALA